MRKKPASSIFRSLLITGILATLILPAKAQDIANGKALFEGNCLSCHQVHSKLIGPALKDIQPRLEEAWLIKWIRNSQKMIEAGDPYALKIYNENNKLAMTAFESLTDAEIKDILAYIADEGAKAPVAAVAAPGDQAAGAPPAAAPAGDGGMSGTVILLILAGMLLLAGLLLLRIKSFLKDLILNKYPERQEEIGKNWYQSRFLPWLRGLNPTIASLVVITVFMLAFGGWFFTYANTEIGVQQGYAPTQPINFSHKLHAGDYAIDCKYCHSGVEVSKQATVPPVSTCMNCHSYIDAAAKYGGNVSPEIQKIRTAFETNTPIKWVRIHNLPDLSYFNHAQHVSVGKVECQACHGPVETMDKVSQHASLQMGWCVNCHRESKVDVENNDYYEQLHADLEKRGKRSISVAHNGGLECGKCHY